MNRSVAELGRRLLVAAPLRIEARALRRGAPGLHVLRTGMGRERSRCAVARLRADPSDRLAVVGFCGALIDGLTPGDAVVASELRVGEATEALAVPGALLAALEREGLSVHVGALLSVPRLARGGERRALRASGALAVDMESAWLAAGKADRPLVVVRIVLDGPRHELLRIAFIRNLVHAARSLARVGRALESWSSSLPSRAEMRTPRPIAVGEA
jgi:4-hydroxy-3-methylbut-2-en-1-yl diphosphate reductase